MNAREYLEFNRDPLTISELMEAYAAHVLDMAMKFRPASEAPYDEQAIFLTKEGFAVQGFIYDGDETDFGYVGYFPMPEIPEGMLPQRTDEDQSRNPFES